MFLFLQVRSLDKEKITEIRVLNRDLVEHLLLKLNTRPETVETTHSGTKTTSIPSSSETSSSFSPVINVSFNTQEKLAWNTRKRYESQMFSKIGPIIQHIGSRNAVEVIGVRSARCFSNSLQSVSACLSSLSLSLCLIQASEVGRYIDLSASPLSPLPSPLSFIFSLPSFSLPPSFFYLWMLCF